MKATCQISQPITCLIGIYVLILGMDLKTLLGIELNVMIKVHYH